jgi:hypothetical protein
MSRKSAADLIESLMNERGLLLQAIHRDFYGLRGFLMGCRGARPGYIALNIGAAENGPDITIDPHTSDTQILARDLGQARAFNAQSPHHRVSVHVK